MSFRTMSQYSSALWRRITSKIKIQQATSSLLFTSATLRDFATCWKLGLADPFRNSFHMSYLPEIFNVQIDKEVIGNWNSGLSIIDIESNTIHSWHNKGGQISLNHVLSAVHRGLKAWL